MLHDAAELGDVRRISRLLEGGAKLEDTDYDGSTAIHAAVEGINLFLGACGVYGI